MERIYRNLCYPYIIALFSNSLVMRRKKIREIGVISVRLIGRETNNFWSELLGGSGAFRWVPTLLVSCKTRILRWTCIDASFFYPRGRFSVVKRCLDAKTKKPFVAKIIKYDDDTDRDDTLQEFDIHRSIKGEKVVMLRDAFLLRRYLVLIMDL